MGFTPRAVKDIAGRQGVQGRARVRTLDRAVDDARGVALLQLGLRARVHHRGGDG